ncbi:hypothetical protein [Pimelobacter simplex]|uniref:hypothetical protein n=1 Tax=Nocardioides simplex TaxID=2045 RepID=UPI0021504E2D|nr:hypothetical protein [Pimelobacter simplex]UUW87399.1 hypothetical protein M0M43_16790 [Pimelobacter simplex]UUW96904.1 hypothetical protein M0M48_05435 [Pimelobacter simplex]
MTDVRIRGADDIDSLVRKIREHADAKALRKELYSGLARLSKELRGPMLEVIPTALPKRGGLADLIASRATMKTTAKSGKYAGVSLRFSARGHDIRLLTGERLRHPVFGNRNTWVDQTAGVDPAVFTAKFDEQKPEIQRAIVRVLEEIARKVTA